MRSAVPKLVGTVRPNGPCIVKEVSTPRLLAPPLELASPKSTSDVRITAARVKCLIEIYLLPLSPTLWALAVGVRVRQPLVTISLLWRPIHLHRRSHTRLPALPTFTFLAIRPQAHTAFFQPRRIYRTPEV